MLATLIVSVNVKPQTGTIQCDGTARHGTLHSAVNSIHMIGEVLLERGMEVTVLHAALVVVHEVELVEVTRNLG